MINLAEEKEIAKRIADKIAEQTGYSLRIAEAGKLNATRAAILVDIPDTNIAPVFYLPDGLIINADISDITDELIDSITEHLIDIIAQTVRKIEHGDVQANEAIEYFKSKEKILDNVVFSLANRTWNEEAGKKWVTMPLDGDLEYIYHIVLGLDNEGKENIGGIKISKDHIEKLGITVEELHEAALKNTPRILPGHLRDVAEVFPTAPTGVMYEVGNEYAFCGAAAIFYPEIKAKLKSMFGDNYVILPSSIHEVIILPVSAEVDIDTLNAMIKHINKFVVNPHERLSDHVYKIVHGKLVSII